MIKILFDKVFETYLIYINYIYCTTYIVSGVAVEVVGSEKIVGWLINWQSGVGKDQDNSSLTYLHSVNIDPFKIRSSSQLKTQFRKTLVLKKINFCFV